MPAKRSGNSWQLLWIMLLVSSVNQSTIFARFLAMHHLIRPRRDDLHVD